MNTPDQRNSDEEESAHSVQPRVPVCGKRFQQILQAKRVTERELSRLAKVSPNTLREIRRNVPKREAVYRRICEALDIQRADLEVNPEVEEDLEFSLPAPFGWIIEAWLSPVLTIENDIQFRLAKLRHRQLPIKFARGKLFDLLDVAPQNRKELDEHLLRHPRVCAKVAGKAGFAINHDIKPFKENAGWWIIDEWIPGTTLVEEVARGRLWIDRSRAEGFGAMLLERLVELHKAGIILRVLTPERVYLDGEQLVLTDFELAKLVRSTLSVSGLWESQNVYRAPEVDDRKPHARSDLYSWARIMLFMMTGSPESATDSFAPGLKSVGDMLTKCLNRYISKRPGSAAVALKQWRAAWKKAR